ncbi:hypothetical protein B0H67DRAFT_452566, partial [Lasiosphaeris hirsuta]
MPPPNPELRRQVIAVYKVCPPQYLTQLPNGCPLELLNLGKDYPQGFDYFRPRLHRAFMANAGLQGEDEIREGIAKAKFVQKG